MVFKLYNYATLYYIISLFYIIKMIAFNNIVKEHDCKIQIIKGF